MKYLLFICAVFLASCSSKNKSSATELRSSADTATTIVNEPNASDAHQNDVNNWKYDNKEDPMDGTKSYFAFSTSPTVLDFDFPYDGGSTSTLVVRKIGNTIAVVLTIDKGQFATHYDGTNWRAKIDSGKAFPISVSEAADGSSDVVFLQPAGKLITQIKNAKKVFIEAEFFQEGKQMIEFNVDGLKWEH